MPIKIPKGFARRKSSGNVLEEVKKTPEPSFRVLERPRSETKSLDNIAALGVTDNHRTSYSPFKRAARASVDDRLASNRGSGGSNTNSTSTGIDNDNASSTRLSTSSTVPSSTDMPSGDNMFLPGPPKHSFTVPVPPIPESQPAFSLRAGGRTFSFGSRTPKPPPAVAPIAPSVAKETPEEVSNRARTLTESSYASTATPPKLETQVEASDFGGLSGMFESYGKRRSTVLDERRNNESDDSIASTAESYPSQGPSVPARSYVAARGNHATLSPIQIDRSADIDPSPFSWGSRTSNDLLLSSPNTNSRPFDPSPSPQTPLGISMRGSSPLMGPRGSTAATPLMNQPQRPGAAAIGGIRRSTAFASNRASVPLDDEDARLVLDSVHASRALDRSPATPVNPWEDTKPSPGLPSAISNGNLFDSSLDEVKTVGRSGSGYPKSGTMDRPRYGEYPTGRTQSDTVASSSRMGVDSQPTKVMTPAQFDRYRRQQELMGQNGEESKSEASDEEDVDDDEDEAERLRQLAKQRRKQEAHLAVYRQQMKKVSGEQRLELPSLGQGRPTLGERGSESTPNLLSRISTLDFGEKPSRSPKESDDDDDDIPLGILAAHGFPHKNRPPARLSTVNPDPIVRSATQLGSYSAGASPTGGHNRTSTLPVFAKNLPQDPYFGAGIVNPSNRESLAFGHNAAGSSQGGAPGVPPGGLVGVIAGEERARAMRRGSPNAQGGYVPPGTHGIHPTQPVPQLPSQMPMMGPGMGMGGMPIMSPGDQAQIQMSQQMQQMMQMQMQWMQQMMQMQGIQGGQMPPQPPTNSFLAPPSNSGRAMSMSMIPNHGGMGDLQAPLNGLDPGMSSWTQDVNRQSQYAASMHNRGASALGYAPSIAPSERSNVGMPTRYRPVSVAPAPAAERRDSMHSTVTLQNLAEKRISKSPTKVRATQSDEDEDEGWEEMKKKREKKKSNWKLKKNTDSFKDMFLPGNSI